jgi:maleylpyruvate isomerase
MAHVSKPVTGTQIYGFWRSIASFRVRVAIKLKGLPFDETPIDILSGEQLARL